MSSTSNKIITSFGSGFTKPDDPLYNEIEQIGKVIAEGGWTLCSGGYFGTMEAISKGAKSSGGKTVGITVRGWNAKPNDFIDEEVKMPNLMERIVELIGIADCYIIFKGGTGTLVEISTALELMNKKVIPEKPLIFYTDFWMNVIETLKLDSKNLSELIERNVKFISNYQDISLYLN
ncbi:MAG TPA: LOG family protein [Ignavibacteria bacterium]|nr:LOG family protein [Ignavibacteria bacterium]